MPAARGHVQRLAARRDFDPGKRRSDVVRIRKNVRFAVVGALFFELIPRCLLNRIERHERELASKKILGKHKKGVSMPGPGALKFMPRWRPFVANYPALGI